MSPRMMELSAANATSSAPADLGNDLGAPQQNRDHQDKEEERDTSQNSNSNSNSKDMSRSSSQAEAVAAQVEASTHGRGGSATSIGDPGDDAVAPSTPPRPPPRAEPVRQESALKRLGKRLRFRRRSYSAPPAPGRHRRQRTPLMEQHFNVDRTGGRGQAVVLPGLPRHFAEDNWARDLHDFFNLIALVPVVALNMMNWNWDLLLPASLGSPVHGHASAATSRNHHHHHNNHHHHHYSNRNHDGGFHDWDWLSQAWEGDYFQLFFTLTALYFVIDLCWVCVEPNCVRSPATIAQHHLATLLYILIPYRIPQVQWCMGACMSVEINTWLLIARRVFNKQGFPPWTILDWTNVGISIRVKLISLLFYITWIAIRCILYPYLLIPIWMEYKLYSAQVGTPWNLVTISLPLHAVFCLLNLKWSYDLLMSKLRYWRRRSNSSNKDNNSTSGNSNNHYRDDKDKGL